jgi:hypothetical protein
MSLNSACEVHRSNCIDIPGIRVGAVQTFNKLQHFQFICPCNSVFIIIFHKIQSDCVLKVGFVKYYYELTSCFVHRFCGA